MHSYSKKEWERETLGPLIRKHGERRKTFVSESGIEQDAIFTPDDLNSDEFDYYKNVGYPGAYPFVRGIKANMYRGRLWTMRQYSGFGSAEETNRRFHYLLEQGQTGLSVAFDLPTQIGYDSDHPLARGEVGNVGVPISHLGDMEILFKDIPLDKVSTSMTINTTAAILLSLYIVVARNQGVPLDKINGTIQNDILKEYIARGTYDYPPKESMRLVLDTFKYCSEHVPRWNTISVSGYHMREAGATAPQELAFTFSNALTYVKMAIDAGLNVDDVGSRISFFFVAHNNLLEEVAKFRAARRIWARIMKERFGASNPESMALRFHVQTAGVTLTAQQPDNNTVRTTIQALAALLGGTQSLHVNSRDEALGLPSEDAAQLSLRTQQIIAYESGIADIVDPLAGSYYVEHITNRIERETLEYIHRIDDMGGAVAALEKGFQSREIHEAAYRHQKEVETGSRVVVGVNKYISKEEMRITGNSVDKSFRERQIDRLSSIRKQRNSLVVKKRLIRVEEAARTDENVVPVIIEAVEDFCTLGEISNVFRKVFGQYKD
jgi:methylmalonyl-CoA mutase N-terminal domain/subunit